MKINLAKSSGFCFGVKRALEIARRTLSRQDNVYMLGDIVHNEDVVRKIRKAGIKKIAKLTRGRNKILLIRAHGASAKIFTQARKLGYEVVDATCPRVKEIHHIAKGMELKGYKIIVIGDNKHDEVQGIIGQLRKKAIVIDASAELPVKLTKKIKKAAIVVQSTQNMEKVLKLVADLRPRIKQLQFFNTICKPTRLKQEEIKILPSQNQVIIIIGSRTSANTKRLYQISKSLNKRSHWVQSKKELKAKWFEDAQKVGVAAGASTPDATTREVIAQINRYACCLPRMKKRIHNR